MEAPPVPKRELPWAFIDCDSDDLVVLIAHMLNRLIEHNDQVELTSSSLTRFHSRAPPQISVIDYLRRIVKYTNVEKLPLLSLLAYIDITCISLPTFTLSSLTVHRFLISGVTAGSKALCDVFCTNSHYAKVGGIKVGELNGLEREFLKVTEWNLCVHAELLQQYYTSLIKSHGGYTQASKPPQSVFTTFPLEQRTKPRVVTDEGDVVSEVELDMDQEPDPSEGEVGGLTDGLRPTDASQAVPAAPEATASISLNGDNDIEMADPDDDVKGTPSRQAKGKETAGALGDDDDVDMNPPEGNSSMFTPRRSAGSSSDRRFPFPISSSPHGSTISSGESRPELGQRTTSGSLSNHHMQFGLSPGGTVASPRLSAAEASGSGSASASSSAHISPVAAASMSELRNLRESLTIPRRKSDHAEQPTHRRLGSEGDGVEITEGSRSHAPHEPGIKHFVGGLFKSRSFASWTDSKRKANPDAGDVGSSKSQNTAAEQQSTPPVNLTPRIRTRSERSTDGLERGRTGKQKRQEHGSAIARVRGQSEDSAFRNDGNGGDNEDDLVDRGRTRQDGKPVVRGVGVG